MSSTEPDRDGSTPSAGDANPAQDMATQQIKLPSVPPEPGLAGLSATAEHCLQQLLPDHRGSESGRPGRGSAHG